MPVLEGLHKGIVYLFTVYELGVDKAVVSITARLLVAVAEMLHTGR